MFTPEQETNYQESMRRLELSYTDSSYQAKLSKYCSLIEKINERYSVLNSLNLFQTEQGDALVELCVDCIKLEAQIKKKREYYENYTFDSSPAYKTLAMIYEKRGEYDKVVDVCVFAIDAGYPSDGTKGGMRGRMARAIKRGKIEVTDEMKTILEI